MAENGVLEFAALIQLYTGRHGVCSFGGSKSDKPKYGTILSAALLYIYAAADQYGIDGNQMLADLVQMAKDDAISFIPSE